MTQRTFFFLFFSLVLACSPAMGQITIPELNVTVWTEAEVPVSVVVAPDGSGASFDQACAWGGSTVDATIRLEMLDGFNDPIYLFPAEDIWLESVLGGLILCQGGSIADAPTDAQGRTYWISSLRAGGYADPNHGDGLVAVVNGDRTIDPALGGVTLVSPDLNGDLAVTLVDLSFFASDYWTAVSGNTARRSDYYWDDTLNLADLAIFAALYGVACP